MRTPVSDGGQGLPRVFVTSVTDVCVTVRNEVVVIVVVNSDDVGFEPLLSDLVSRQLGYGGRGDITYCDDS